MEIEELSPIYIPSTVEKLHYELIEAAFRSVRGGLPEKTAAAYLGVPFSLWKKWKHVGTNQIKRREWGLETLFVLALNRADAELQKVYIDQLHGVEPEEGEAPLKMSTSQIMGWIAQRWPSIYGAVAAENALGEEQEEKERRESLKQIRERLAARKADQEESS